MTINEMVLSEIKKSPVWGYTPDEVAAHIEESILSVRPAVTKLYQQGYLKRTGRKRRNFSGKYAYTYVAA